MSVYITQNGSTNRFDSSESWTILTPIEISIKRKIEAIGVPLKDWNINIYRGILTGCNEAFIISREKKDALIQEDPKSAEIIRPILRGRDIKRYEYCFADLWLIATFPSLHYDIEKYPAIKNHLLSFGIEKLEQTGKKFFIDGEEIQSRKKTNNKWFETQDSISYWDDFSKQKIVYREISDAMDACMVPPDIMLNNKCYFITGDHLPYIITFLNSSLFTKIILPQTNLTGGKGEGFLSSVSLIRPQKEIELRLIALYDKKTKSKHEVDYEIDSVFCDLYGLTIEEKNYILSNES